MPSAGHVIAGESSIEGAIRETKEELGVETTKDDYMYIGEFIYDETWEIAQIYLLKKDLKIEDLKLEKEEVSEVKWLSLEEFKEIFYSSEFVPFNDEYRSLAIDLLEKQIKEV